MLIEGRVATLDATTRRACTAIHELLSADGLRVLAAREAYLAPGHYLLASNQAAEAASDYTRGTTGGNDCQYRDADSWSRTMNID